MKQKMIFLALTLWMLSAASANAQVTIGSNANPPAYSLLELDTENVKGGLHLPRLTTAERNAMSLNTDAAGLLIFNTSTNCLDIWTGTTWKSQCESSLPGGTNPSAPATLEENGRYALYGKILFDINDGDVSDYPAPYSTYPSDYPHTCDLSSELNYSYTLKSLPVNAYTFSAVQFTVNDPTKLLASYTTNSTAGMVTLTFKSLTEVQALVGDAGRTNAKKITITAFFLDNRGSKKKVELAVRVQNAPVGCSVRKVDDPANPTVSGWLTFMCYNLGADPDYGDPAAQKAYVPSPNTNSSTDRTVYGDLFQWGRVADGHQRRDLTLENVWPADHSGSVSGFTNDPVPNNAANINTATGQVLETDMRFGKFIRRTSNNYDWIAGTTAVYNNRWNAGTEISPVKATADPCPEGWRVPTRTEWTSIYGATNCESGANCYTNAKVNQWTHNFATPPAGDAGTHGISLTPSDLEGTIDYSSPATFFLPAEGNRNRDTATISNSGTDPIYWSSTTIDVISFILSCNSTSVRPGNAHGRSRGHSVRCISE
ncbi:MAG: hypothetical protein LBG15_11745 [Dysgonamonadaceae bacterium]|jgi:uncharacterized protein (TIGR02145 family)|nr:hypothetical protein [Dysgonamonadaceae bacterium]